MTIQKHGNSSTSYLKLSNITCSSQATPSRKKRASVDISIAPSMQTVSSQSTLTSVILMNSVAQNWIMIGILYAMTSKSSVLDTQHCQHKCHRRVVPLCQTQQMESNHQEIICPLRSQRKDLLSKLFHLMGLWRTTTLSYGRWKATQDI